MKNKGLKIFLGILLLLVIIYLAGPRLPKPEFNLELPPEIIHPEIAEQIVLALEDGEHQIKPDNEARIIWAGDSLKSKTRYALLYLHGYSASPMEGNPVHVDFAVQFGMNAYLHRLPEHGLVTDEPLLNMTPEILWESAKQALIIAKALGDQVIIMGTSSGATLALKLVAEFPGDIAGLYLYSPNIRISNKVAVLLSRPWGVHIGRLAAGGKYRILGEDPVTDPYWYNTQRVEGVAYLQQLVEATMKEELFSRIELPVFMGYYYKDEENQDETVSIEAMLRMFDELGTPENMKRKVAFPEAGEHVITSNLLSGSWMDVKDESIKFAREILKIEN